MWCQANPRDGSVSGGANILIQLARQTEPYDVLQCRAVPVIIRAGLQQRGQPGGRPWERRF